VVIVLAAASGSKHQHQTTTASTPLPREASRSPAHSQATHARATALTRCDQNISVSSHATCGFAANVFRAYVDALNAEPGGLHNHSVEATSSITGKTYSMNCSVSGAGSITTCSGGVGAVVTFPLLAAQVYRAPTTKTPAPSTRENAPSGEEEPTTPPSEEGAPGEQDEVGSSSHATDSQFCSEHECIGSFETEGGTIIECSDGSYSHAGGISGACSHHGGEN